MKMKYFHKIGDYFSIQNHTYELISFMLIFFQSACILRSTIDWYLGHFWRRRSTYRSLVFTFAYTDVPKHMFSLLSYKCKYSYVNVMVVFTMLTMYNGFDTTHDVCHPRTFPPLFSWRFGGVTILSDLN